MERKNGAEDKLELYRSLKTKLEMEEYLVESSNRLGTRWMTKLRGGSSELAIETGRYAGLPIHLRTCAFCIREVEDERHVMFECRLYAQERKIMQDRIVAMTKSKISFTRTKSNEDRMLKMLIGDGVVDASSGSSIVIVVKQYLASAMRRRAKWMRLGRAV